MINIAIYGGTFDPVHKGHTETALTIQKSLHFDRFFFLPCKDPLLKSKAKASATQRHHMLSLALEKYPQFSIDTREIHRSSSSRMIETLQSLRKEYPEASITLIMGTDAFHQLPDWYQWKDLTTLSHLLVMQRADFQKPLPAQLISFLEKTKTENPKDLLTLKQGCVLFMEVNSPDISSSGIRQKIQEGTSVETLLDEKVYAYIQEQGFYNKV